MKRKKDDLTNIANLIGCSAAIVQRNTNFDRTLLAKRLGCSVEFIEAYYSFGEMVGKRSDARAAAQKRRAEKRRAAKAAAI